ncbi:type 1 glutamine amidotransferase domain-containing protein [Bradyrhizobium sp.]|uniref:type 1 glutamine amidotransferase domain-containing protein n=1 Tax=Bradyrhizobium sp. TaxID=376 RepID=UPI002D5962CC|nr:type 1 glutamine amidotransferase domain-containing protein [Bradyrhizobium sp.]HZR74263.1 type 1 glutamine amidotransferase domain-containing protein [Bradyrhizobium sp.]
MARVLIPLPARDFDPSEAAVSWQVLSKAGHTVTFATPDGRSAAADDMMLSGEGLDLWGGIPLLKKLPLIGLLMRANSDARNAYAAMITDRNYAAPLRWDAVDPSAFDALLLPGGHRARGMREYLESEMLQRCVADFFEAQKPVAAICHGVLLAARSISAKTGRSVLYGYKTTALTWALENSAWKVARITRFWDPNYYRTYLEKAGESDGYMSVQQEVTRALASPGDFLDVPKTDPDFRRKTSGLQRDTMDDARPAFVVQDRNYVSARWPGDVHTFAKAFASLM